MNEEIVLSADVIEVNGSKILTRMSHDAYFKVSVLLPSAQHEDAIDKVNELVDAHEEGFFKTKEIKFNKELKKAI